MNREIISLYGRVVVPAASKDKVTPEDLVFALNKEVAVFGYALDGKVIKHLKGVERADLLSFRKELLATLSVLSGAGNTYNILFNKFPYETPEKQTFLLQRMIAYMANRDGVYDNTNYRVLDCGHAIDPTIFDLNEFGGCPICGAQSEGIDSPEDIKHTFQRFTPLKPIQLADDDFLSKTGSALLARNSSLSQDERKLLREIGAKLPVTMPEKMFRETLPLAYGIFGSEIIKSISSATDIMRIAYYVSNADSDLSLAENVRFKIPTKDRKAFLRMLDTKSLDSLCEDMLRHRERWVKLGSYLNPGSKENRRKYPTVAAAFDKLTKAPKTIKTFNRTVETKVRTHSVDAELLAMLSKRPGEFARKIDFLLRTTTDHDAVIVAFRDVVPNITTKMLFELNKYLGSRDVEKRVFVPKGQVNKLKVFKDTRAAIPMEILLLVSGIIEDELQRRLSARSPMGKVFIDPSLKNMMVPYNRRGDSSTQAAVTKGSRNPIDPDTKVIRLFQWWKGRDVDLSAVLFDARYKVITQVSYTNLSSFGMKHSGDITYAPNGASEFIDVDIAKCLARGVRYVAMSVISYSGEKFSDIVEAYAGFMERDSMTSGARFEPQAVKVKYTVNTPTTQTMPLVFDLVTREVIFADLAGSSRHRSSVDGQEEKISLLMRGVLEMPMRKPTFNDIIDANARARGEIVLVREDADIVYDADLDVDATIAEMMA